MVHARDVGRPDAGGRAVQAPSTRIAQLHHALAAEEHDAAPASEPSHLARRPGSGRQPVHGRRAAACEDRDRHQEPRA
jgi:hypothetical protein